jgi:hypothetical protein
VQEVAEDRHGQTGTVSSARIALPVCRREDCKVFEKLLAFAERLALESR